MSQFFFFSKITPPYYVGMTASAPWLESRTFKGKIHFILVKNKVLNNFFYDCSEIFSKSDERHKWFSWVHLKSGLIWVSNINNLPRTSYLTTWCPLLLTCFWKLVSWVSSNWKQYNYKMQSRWKLESVLWILERIKPTVTRQSLFTFGVGFPLNPEIL